ncbi:alpha/beta fold hydrolase [Glutamicibacter sp.]|uniref:alpha/beta fold hydrolase n=1 Tax=Glutamicibacter sp. TaxID=1931995 RepID=UPI0028BEBF26|nr:alpha/beta fold hydrolase [Glutamicibacter sp.]
MPTSEKTIQILRPLVGLSLIVLGGLLIFNSSVVSTLIIWLLSAGLILAGLLRMLEAQDSTGHRASALVAGGLLFCVGIIAPFWRGITLPVLALAVSIALLVGGILRFIDVLTGEQRPAIRGLLSATTGIFGAVLVLFWPKLSLWVLGVAFGAWLVIKGLHVLGQSIGSSPRFAQRMQRPASAALTTLTLIGLVAVLGLGAATAWMHGQSQRVVSDDFYLPPASVPSQPGQLIRVEPLEGGNLPDSHAWRILYTTTDESGDPSVASGIVTIPSDVNGKLPVISWANGTKGVASRCALSESQTPYDDGPSVARTQMLDSGWAVVATDYIGLGTAGPHPYLVPKSEAHAVLDATRAAGQIEELKANGVSFDSRTVLWGHSQGGHAALASAKEAPTYAPELQVLGVAAMAPATDLKQLAASVANSPAGKVISSYIATSWNQLYPELQIEQGISGASASASELISKSCFFGTDTLTVMAQASQLFEPIFNSQMLNGSVGTKLEENSAVIPTKVPVFIAQGAADSLVLPSMQRQFFEKSCSANEQIAYAEYENLDHMPLVGPNSAVNQDVADFTKDLLDSKVSYPSAALRCAGQ